MVLITSSIVAFPIFSQSEQLTHKLNTPVPEYTSNKSLDEEPLQIQKDLYIPQRSGNVIGIQKKVLKEVGAAENSFDTDDDAGAHHDMD